MSAKHPGRGRPRKTQPVDVKDSKSSVLSLAKGFRILEAFSGDVEEMTQSEIADLAGLDAGTTFRMLNTLVDLGYVARVGDSRRFRLTLKVLDLGFNAIARKDQRALVRPVLQSLVGEISEAASFGVLEGGDVLYIERVRAGFTRLGVDIRIGTTIPANTTAIGYAILAFVAPAMVERTLAIPSRHPLTVRPPSRVELDKILDGVRKRGFILQESLISSGLHILATPVLDPAGHAVGAVSVAAPIIRVSAADLLKRALPHVLAAAKDIGRALQASGSTNTVP
jgi:IclR family transcriptional regulator, pca regulon regulatory protein